MTRHGIPRTGFSRRGLLVLGGLATAATTADLTLAAPAPATTPQLVLDSWFRVETRLDFTGPVGVQTARLFLGGNRHGTTPDETLTANLTGPTPTTSRTASSPAPTRCSRCASTRPPTARAGSGRPPDRNS